MIVGERIFRLPVVTSHGVVKTGGYDNVYSDGLSQEAVVDDWGHIKLDPQVDPVLGALLDPVATGIELVRRTGTQAGDVAAVTGVVPVGLGAIVEFVSRDAAGIMASDPSACKRELAILLGARHAVDPREQDRIGLSREQGSLFRAALRYDG